MQGLADILNAVERTGKWPEATPTAKAVFLPKAEDSTADPLSFRMLLILPTLYRRWASTRLRSMTAWIEKWSTEEMFAGTSGQGAQDGWYDTAVQAEYAEVMGVGFTGTTADIHKCFDQIQRPAVYRLAREAGIPSRVLTAYMAFQESLVARNTLAGRIG